MHYEMSLRPSTALTKLMTHLAICSAVGRYEFNLLYNSQGLGSVSSHNYALSISDADEPSASDLRILVFRLKLITFVELLGC